MEEASPARPKPARKKASKACASTKTSQKRAKPSKNTAKGETGSRKGRKTFAIHAGTKAIETRTDTKKAIVVELLRRKEGATIAEIAKATQWQNHTIRGFVSGNVGKKMGLAVELLKNEAGVRAYRITK